MNKVVSEDKNRCLVYYFLFIDIFLVLMEISFFRWISEFFYDEYIYKGRI